MLLDLLKYYYVEIDVSKMLLSLMGFFFNLFWLLGNVFKNS